MTAEQDENLWIAEIWLEHRARLLNLLRLKMPEVLTKRLSAEDLLQETYIACSKAPEFLREKPELPMYVKLRFMALQTLAAAERHHLGREKRDAMRECSPDDGENEADAWARFADTVTSPRTHLERQERRAMARRVMEQLTEADREILELRHFEELGNNECAAVLGISVKAASIRYIRALERMKQLVMQENPYA